MDTWKMGKTNETAGPDLPSHPPCPCMQAKHPVIGGVQLVHAVEKLNPLDFFQISQGPRHAYRKYMWGIT
jgi:hypothetical protein